MKKAPTDFCRVVKAKRWKCGESALASTSPIALGAFATSDWF
jgi:hypothetical protein